MIKKILPLLIVILLGTFLRLFRLSDFPIQLNNDEITQLYDAISIAQTGKDIYGNYLPFIFPSVGDFKPPFYTYITSFFYLIFGGGELTIRLPAAIFGTLTIAAIYFLVLKLLNNKYVAFYTSFLTAISPFEIFFSRKSFEGGAGIFFIVLGFSFILHFLEKKRNIFWLYFAAVALGVSMYIYFSYTIIIPPLLLAFILIFRKYFLGNVKTYFPLLLLFILMIFPLFIMVLTNPNTRYRSQTVFITQDVNLGRKIEYAKTAYDKIIFDFSFSRFLEQFDPIHLFGNGLDFTNQGPLGVGPLYLIQLPFLILGIIYLLRMNNFVENRKFILIWILIGMIPSALTFEPHSPHRSMIVFTMLNVITAAGFYYFVQMVGIFSSRQNFIKVSIYSILSLYLIANFIYFMHMYFVNFPWEKSQQLQYPFKQVAQFAWSQYPNFNQIVFDPLYGQTAPVIGTAAHYYLAYFGNYSPVLFQKEYKIGTKDREVLFDKFSIRKVEWKDDQHLKNTLIIASPWSLPIDSIDKNKILRTFYFYDRQVAFYAIKL